MRQMLAWMQSVMACLFLHPGALWAGGVVVWVMSMGENWASSRSVCLRLVKRAWNDITVTSQSQHTVSAFPICPPAKLPSLKFLSFFFFFVWWKWKPWMLNLNLQILTLTTNILGNTEWITWRQKQEVNQPISFSFTSVGPPLWLLVGRAFYTPNTEVDTWTSHVRRSQTLPQPETVITDSWISAELLKETVSVCRLHANGGTVRSSSRSRTHLTNPDLKIQDGFSLINSCEAADWVLKTVLSSFYQSTSCFYSQNTVKCSSFTSQLLLLIRRYILFHNNRDKLY